MSLVSSTRKPVDEEHQSEEIVEEEIVFRAAFRCVNCGHLVPPEHAGENERPHACPVCGRGVTFQIDPSAKDDLDRILREMADPGADRVRLLEQLTALPREKVYHPENWEVLAEADDARLEDLGLVPDDVCEHEPEKITTPRQGRFFKAEADDGAGSDDGSNASIH